MLAGLSLLYVTWWCLSAPGQLVRPCVSRQTDFPAACNGGVCSWPTGDTLCEQTDTSGNGHSLITGPTGNLA